MEYIGSDALFATHVARYKVTELVDELTEIYDSYDKDDSLWEYNQTKDVHIFDKYEEIKKTLVFIAKDFLVDKLNFDCDIQMTTSWLTKTFPEDYSRNLHTHHNSWWSGVIYLHNDCAIQLNSVIAGISSFEVPLKKFSIDSTNLSVYQTDKGDMLLFPSQTPHMIVKKEDKEYKHIRRSIAFNFMPKGNVGIADSFWKY